MDIIDDRYSEGHIVSHSDMRIESQNVASTDRVLVGASGLYEARCRHCFDPHLAAVQTARQGRP